MNECFRVVIFARTPEPGRVKTRLIPALGAQGACTLHRRMLVRILGQARRAFPAGRIELWVTPDPGHRWLRRLARAYRASLHQQIPRTGRADHLGERMAAALNAGPWPAMVVGSDVPGLDAAHLQRLARQVVRPATDIALVPASDGGYVALAGARPLDVFEGIAWGTSWVMEQTLRRARETNLRTRILAPRPDIDRPEDLRHCPPMLLRGLAVSGEKIRA